MTWVAIKTAASGIALLVMITISITGFVFLAPQQRGISIAAVPGAVILLFVFLSSVSALKNRQEKEGK